MKNLLLSLLVGCVAFFIIYLFGCFYNVTFDLSKWSVDSRSMIVFVGGIAFFGGFAFTLINFIENKK